MRKAINDFSSFDAKTSDYLCRIIPIAEPVESKGIKSVYAFGHTSFDARAKALIFFENKYGFHLDYDQLKCEIVEDNVKYIEKDEIVIFSDSTTCGIEIYQTERQLTRSELMNPENLSKWTIKSKMNRVNLPT